jgi:hypothetical protein
LDNGTCPTIKELVLKKHMPPKCYLNHSIISDSTAGGPIGSKEIN